MTSNPSLLEQLYRELGPTLLGYFCQRTGGAAVAEDLLQDTFLRAARHPERIAVAVSPRAYLFGIARHVLLDARRRAAPLAEPLEDAVAPAAATDDRLELVRAAIAELAGLQREALLLKLRQDLSYEEIAHVLGIPVGTVRSRLHHAVAHLKQKLNPGQPSARPDPSPNDTHET